MTVEEKAALARILIEELDTTVDPNAERYTNRALTDPGMIHNGDVVVNAFAAIGWRWGGHFVGDVDYQHFDTAP